MNDATQTGIAMAAIAAVCTVVGSLVGWLKERDQLRYAKDATELKAQNAIQAAQIADLTRRQIECETKNKEYEARLHELELTVLRMADAVPIPTRKADPC